jgi:glutathione S-transferase
LDIKYTMCLTRTGAGGQQLQQQSLVESLALIEWVEEYFAGGRHPALLPASPAARARARAIISRFDAMAFAAFGAMLRCRDRLAFPELLARWHHELTWLEGAANHQGLCSFAGEDGVQGDILRRAEGERLQGH